MKSFQREETTSIINNNDGLFMDDEDAKWKWKFPNLSFCAAMIFFWW